MIRVLSIAIPVSLLCPAVFSTPSHEIAYAKNTWIFDIEKLIRLLRNNLQPKNDTFAINKNEIAVVLLEPSTIYLAPCTVQLSTSLNILFSSIAILNIEIEVLGCTV